MSAIAGVYNLDGRPADRALLGRMLDCVRHRGNDAVRSWTERSIGLGHRQFATTPEAAREIQPTANRSGVCRVTFDGRIDNREELIDRLTPSVGKLSGPTDVDLLLHAYDVWGTECLDRLVGDFAFALWDGGRERLFCARDTYGIRPFYYHFDGCTFLFGSDVQQIFQQPQVDLKIDDAKVAEWFTVAGMGGYVYSDLTKTFFKNISELPFGQFLIADRSGLSVRRYWDASQRSEIRYRRDEEYLDHFAAVFRGAVKAQLRSQRPVGAELSGGLDSSSIVCMAQEIYRSGEIGPGELKTFSLVFDDLTCDERPGIESVVDKYGLRSHYVMADRLCGLRNLGPGMPRRLYINHPQQPHTQEGMEALYGLAHENGVRAMLSGEGAENHVMGSPLVFDSLIKNFKWRDLVERLSTIPSCRGKLSRLIKLGIVPLLLRSITHTRRLDWLDRQYTPPWLAPRFREAMMKEIEAQKSRLRNVPRFPTSGQQAEYEVFNPGDPILLDPMFFHSPIERRFPYHDRRVIEFCLAIPPEVKYRHLGETGKRSVRGRILQREGLRHILPDAIRRSQARVHFDDVLKIRAQKYAKAYREMFARPAAPLAAQLGYIDQRKFAAALSAFLDQAAATAEFDSGVWFWIDWVTKLEMWLQSVAIFGRQRTSDAICEQPL